MKKIVQCFLFCVALQLGTSMAKAQQLVKLWETDSTFKVPESTLYYPEEQIVFVSNIDGKSNEKDLKGSISKMGKDGKMLQHNWAINLSAPKGMGMYDKKLYVADLDEIVVLNSASGEVLQRIPVPGAVFLNDIAIDAEGTLYVSDSRTGKVHKLIDGTVSTFLENRDGVNGLLVSGDNLYLAVKDTIWKMDKNKQFTKMADGIDASSDGIVETTDKDLVVSCWSGIIYYISKDGNKKVLADLRPMKIKTADIGFDAANSILYVPTFFKNNVIAYRLEK